MNRELNTREEMLKRLAYIVYVGCLFVGFVFVVRGLAGSRLTELLGGGALGALAFCLRRQGYRYLEFRRLARSFPMGSREDALSKENRKALEALLHRFHQTEDWVERQEIRAHLERLVAREPLLLEAYRHELTTVHPALAAQTAQ